LDVEISEGKTEVEKREDLLEAQRFEECRLRQIAEATAESHPVPTDGDEEGNDGTDTQDTPALSESPPASNQADAPSQDIQTSNTASTEPGNASPRRFSLPPPRHLREEYSQEFAAMTHQATVSSLSYSELQQCEDYLGVCPEDLGLRLEEFNDLLLEQTLISSMIEMRKAEKRQEKEQAQEQEQEQSRSETAQNIGASSSAAPVEVEEDSGPSLRSHSLPHPILHEDDTNPDRQPEGGHRWSFENVLRTVSNSTPFTFLTSLATGEPSTSSAPELSSPFYSEEVQETAKEEADREEHRTSIEESQDSTDSSHTSTDVWKNLLNSLAGFDNIHAQFRMISVRFDDPCIDAAVNGNAARRREQEVIEMTQRPPVAEEVQRVTEEITMTGERVTKAVAVENPDGSVALISIPNEETPNPNPQEQAEETIGVTPEDTAVMTAMRSADRSQIDAIAEADARLRQLYSRLS